MATKKDPQSLSLPQPEAKPIITCPPELGPAAREEWDRIVVYLAEQGTIEPADRAALAAYCVAYSLYIEAVEGIKTYGLMMKTDSGYPQQSVFVSIANRQFDIMLKIATEFGFTPLSRMRLAKPTTSGLEFLEPLTP